MPLKRLLIACALVVVSATASLAQSPYGGRAPNYYILDVGSGQVLAQYPMMAVADYRIEIAEKIEKEILEY